MRPEADGVRRETEDASLAGRTAALLYGGAVYVLFLAVFLYTVGFVSGLGVPRPLDGGDPGGSIGAALAVDVGLLLLFGLQHSVMARAGFKRWWTRLVPEAVERSTYVLFATLALALLVLLWRPIPAIVWDVETGAARAGLYALQALGWVLVVVSTEQIDGRSLLGLRQAWDHFRGRKHHPPEFQTPGLYRWVRHPLQASFLLAFWAAPTMTLGHLVFAGGFTVYILVGLRLEERDLVAAFGERYRAYRRTTPMLVPGLGGGGDPEGTAGRSGERESAAG